MRSNHQIIKSLEACYESEINRMGHLHRRFKRNVHTPCDGGCGF
jgi:hypothetical protein